MLCHVGDSQPGECVRPAVGGGRCVPGGPGVPVQEHGVPPETPCGRTGPAAGGTECQINGGTGFHQS